MRTFSYSFNEASGTLKLKLKVPPQKKTASILREYNLKFLKVLENEVKQYTERFSIIRPVKIYSGNDLTFEIQWIHFTVLTEKNGSQIILLMGTENTFHIKYPIDWKWRHNKREMKRKLNLEEKKLQLTSHLMLKKAKCFSSNIKNKLMT